MSAYKNIVFDLGNVILNIDPSLSAIAFREAGIQNFAQLYTLSYQTGLFDKLETGRVVEATFCNEIRKISGLSLSDFSIIEAWNALILNFPVENLRFLQQIKSCYRTYILSNTNLIHYHKYSEDLRRHHDIDGLKALVYKAYYSHEIGLRKPDEAIFRYVERDADIIPSETLFIDDSAVNCEAAEKLGWNVILYSDTSLPSLFEKLNLPC